MLRGDAHGKGSVECEYLLGKCPATLWQSNLTDPPW